MEKTNIRALALEALLLIDVEKEYSHKVIDMALEKYSYLSKADRGFFSKVVHGVVEYRLQLDDIIKKYNNGKRVKPVIREILRMSVYQILYMDRVPDRAVINEAVNLVKMRRLQGLTGFVNGNKCECFKSIAAKQLYSNPTYMMADKTADFYADEILFDDWKMRFDLHFLGDIYKVETNLVGLFNVYNVLAAICTAFAKGIAISDAIEALKSFSGVSGRMETVHTDKNYKITLSKEVARECAWGVLAKISKIEDNIEKSLLLEIINKEFGDKIQDLPKMTEKDVENFEVIIQFLNNVFNKMQGEN